MFTTIWRDVLTLLCTICLSTFTEYVYIICLLFYSNGNATAAGGNNQNNGDSGSGGADSGYDEYDEEYSHIITENSPKEIVAKIIQMTASKICLSKPCTYVS